MSVRSTGALVVLVSVLQACASSGAPGGTTPNPYTGTISHDEISQAGVRNAYEAVERLRPRWLLVRGMRSFSIETEIAAFQDRLYLGTDQELRRIGVDGIYSIEYIDGPTAQATLPGLRDRHIQGAIVVHLSPPSN